MKKNGYFYWGTAICIVAIFLLFNVTGNSQAITLSENQQEISQNALGSDEEKEKAHTLNIYDMTNEELYKKIGYISEADFSLYFDENFTDSDKIVILSEGGIFQGKLKSGESGEQFEVDSETDNNAITKKELKDILIEKESDLYEFYQKEIGEK